MINEDSYALQHCITKFNSVLQSILLQQKKIENLANVKILRLLCLIILIQTQIVDLMNELSET